MKHLTNEIDIAVRNAKKWGYVEFPSTELDICVLDTDDKTSYFMFETNLDDAMQMLFDLSRRGYEIVRVSGNMGIVSLFVQPSDENHSTNIDIEVLDRISALFN